MFFRCYFILFFLQVIDGYCRSVTLWPNDTVRTGVGIGPMFIQFFIPVMVLIICYGQIIWVLTKRINTDLMKNKVPVDDSDNVCGPIDNVQKTVDTGKEKFQLTRRNTIKTLLIVGLCFILCWSQNQIIYFMYNCGYNVEFNSVYFDFTIIMVFVNCTINPFIYLIKYKDYQEALRTFFHSNKDQVMINSLNLSTTSISKTSRPTQVRIKDLSLWGRTWLSQIKCKFSTTGGQNNTWSGTTKPYTKGINVIINKP